MPVVHVGHFRSLRAFCAVASLTVLLEAVGPAALLAQGPAPVPCNYTRCALGIAPAWNGLLVTRGVAEERVGNLGFFWARSLAPIFAGSDSAAAYGNRAVRVRQVAAVLTDAGALALGYSLIRGAARGKLDGNDRLVAIAGGSAFVVSVPLQFAADGLLSRAIWWKNAEYSGR